MGESTSPSPSSTNNNKEKLVISKEGAKQLVDQLVRLGYFHDNNNVASCHSRITIPPPDTLESYRKLQKDPPQSYSYSASASLGQCQIIPTLDRSYFYTPEGLVRELMQHLEAQTSSSSSSSSVAQGEECGRKSIIEMAQFLNIDPMYFQQQQQQYQPHNKPLLVLPSMIQIVGSDLISQSYWNHLATKIIQKVQNQGKVDVLDLVKEYSLTSLELLLKRCIHGLVVDVAVPLDKQISITTTTTTVDDDSFSVSKRGVFLIDDTTLVSKHYLETLKLSVLQTFSKMTEPTLINAICQEHGWDLSIVLKWLQNAAKGGESQPSQQSSQMDHDNTTATATNTNIVLQGQVHVDPTSISTSMFLPSTFTKQQQEQLLDFLSTNGYMTADRAKRFGISSFSQMVDLVGQHYVSNNKQEHDTRDNDITTTTSNTNTPTAGFLVIDNVVILDRVLQKIQIASQELALAASTPTANSNTMIVDLQDYIDTELVFRSSLMKKLLDHAGFTNDHGVAVLLDGQAAILVSQQVVERMFQHLLPPLIQDYAKRRAQELFQEQQSNTTATTTNTVPGLVDEDSNEEQHHDSSMGKRKGKKSRKTKHTSRSGNHKKSQDLVTPISAGVVPLLQVAGAVLKEYPFFQDLDPTVEQALLDQADSLSWNVQEEDDDDDDENKARSDILLVEFCNKVIYNPTFRSKCEDAVRAELLRLQSAKESKATVVSRKDAAARLRTVQASFEESFVTCCYMVQAVAKFIALASSSYLHHQHPSFSLSSEQQNQEQQKHFDGQSLEILRQEFLQGFCADLTSRITQYCLFQNDEDDTNIFSFYHPEDDDNDDKPVDREDNDDSDPDQQSSSGLLPYCSPIDTAMRRFPKVYLSCPPPREPLPILRESLSSNLGVTLARQWLLCGGACYRGGIRKASENKSDDGDGSDFIRPGNMEGFISHVEENCLTLCGLPFKKLDKKSEKQFLFARRQNLIRSLQNTSDPQTVLELTIMILFQQVKQVVVLGTLLRGPVLRMLMDERKISEPVAKLLLALNKAIERDDDVVSEQLVAAVKECGLCRDISKHEVPASILDEMEMKA